MATFEPVLTALARLSEPQSPWHFYNTFPSGEEPTHAETLGAPLLQLALQLEDIIRDVIRQIVILAANEATNKEARWLKLSEHLAEDDDQQRAVRSIRQLKRRLEERASWPETGQNRATTEAEQPPVIATLRRTAAQLEEICNSLEKHLPQTGETTSPDHARSN